MLTPRFELTQTEDEVLIVVHAPYANIKDTEVYVEGTDFRFYSTPYYLRLKLPGEIEENDSSVGSYDCDKGDFSLRFSKVNKGEYFENLDMITTLLAPPKKKSTVLPNIEVIGNPSANSEGIQDTLNDNSTTENTINEGDEWFVPQVIPNANVFIPGKAPKYGFANKVSEALQAFEPAWIKEIIDLPMPDSTPQSKRKHLREKQELLDFNEGHYMADLMQPECVEPYLHYTAEWETLQKENITLTETEVDLLKELPNKEYLLTDEEVQKLLLSVIDILFASCYNTRTTLGESTVESGWTIGKLSSTLSWFQDFSDPEEVVTACFRRSLCYPLFRNWNLSMKVLDDVRKSVNLGKRYIIKRFCEIHSLFNNSCEPRYILNKLYIKDYLIWLQQIHESLVESIDSLLSSVHPEKQSMGFDLVELEQAAYSVQEEDLVIENSVHEIVDQMDELTVSDHKKDELSSDSDNDSSDSDSESSDSDSESTSSTTSSSSSNTSTGSRD